MPTILPPVVYDNATATHRPLSTGEALDSSAVPLSGVFYNLLRNNPDGLYAGPLLLKQVYYVAAAGIDGAPNDGSKALPFKTLDFTLHHLIDLANGFFNASTIIALKAGETFTTVDSFPCYGTIQLTFYGDPQYGDFDGPLANGTTRPCDMSDLQRPIINVGIDVGSSGQAGIILIASPSNIDSQVILMGVWINLPSGAHATGAVDFITAGQGTRSNLQLFGSVINITDNTTVFGLMGWECGAWGFVYQRCSQFRINGILVTDATSTPNLLARKWFFKFYPDYRAIHEGGLEIFGGAPGTGIMNLSWSDIASDPVGTSTSLGTYPTLQDPSFGLANYFFNLTRDQQNRPLNCISGRLF
jgi:hypothetical protein